MPRQRYNSLLRQLLSWFWGIWVVGWVHERMPSKVLLLQDWGGQYGGGGWGLDVLTVTQQERDTR